jgi:HK97 family phage portal protein
VKLFAPLRNVETFTGVQRFISGRATFQDGKYETYAKEGYQINALVFACVNELASSVSEPSLQARQGGRWRHFDEEGTASANRLLRLMMNPNPYMGHALFWSGVVMHRSIAGNAFAVKERTRSGAVRGLRLVRPDRMSIVPDAEKFISHYEYNIGDREPIKLPPQDVIHWKTLNPLNDFYGYPPLGAIAKAVDLDNFAFDFVSQYFEQAGIPSGILSTKAKMNDLSKKEIRERFARELGGRGKWHGLLVLDGADATYTQMTQSLGAQGLVLPELNKIIEARITGALGVPPTLVGTVIGTEASSYGNKKSERESFWNETMKPLYRELVDPLNKAMFLDDFPGVQEVTFDLSTVGALLPDADALATRWSGMVTSGIAGQKEARIALGLPAEPETDDVFFIPSNLTQTPKGDVGAMPELAPAPSPVAVGVNGNGRGA